MTIQPIVKNAAERVFDALLHLDTCDNEGVTVSEIADHIQDKGVCVRAELGILLASNRAFCSGIDGRYLSPCWHAQGSTENQADL